MQTMWKFVRYFWLPLKQIEQRISHAQDAVFFWIALRSKRSSVRKNTAIGSDAVTRFQLMALA